MAALAAEDPVTDAAILTREAPPAARPRAVRALINHLEDEASDSVWYMVAINPAHRWVYFPDLHRDELLLFRGYDSDPARSRRVPHTAFDDPSGGDDAPPRESIDIRCVAFFD